MKIRSTLVGVVTAAMAVVTFAAIPALPAQAAQPSVPAPTAGAMPSAVPSAITPSVDDGEVDTISQVGNTIIIGGTFTSVGGQPRNHIAAFNATTGALSTTFVPQFNGSEIIASVPGPFSNSVFIGGDFSTVNGTAVVDLTLLNATNGSIITSFHTPVIAAGEVKDLVLRGNRLYLGGFFQKVAAKPHFGLASLNATTGALDPFMNVQVAGRHNDSGSGAQGSIGPWAIDVTPDGQTMVAIGDFKTADGLPRDQVVMIDLSGASAVVNPNWQTNRYNPYCFNWAFDGYVRGVNFSPDGSYFVINATGGGNPGTLCDATARFNTNDRGLAIQPVWVDETGGDTTWAVTITDTAVFVGGHNRWNNNPLGADRALPGAVPRPGLAALDPVSGRPLTWNPGRNPLGTAVYALLATSQGLWLGSNTNWIGNFKYQRPKIAFFPYAGGTPVVKTNVGTLPGTAYLAGSTSNGVTNVLYRVNAGGGAIQSLDNGPDWAADNSDPSPYRNSGSNAAGWNTGASETANVPATTPNAIFDSERWSPSDSPAMNWDFPVPAGTHLQVRLYFANRCTCTQRRRPADLQRLPGQPAGHEPRGHRGRRRRPAGHDEGVRHHLGRQRRHRHPARRREPAHQRHRDHQQGHHPDAADGR